MGTLDAIKITKLYHGRVRPRPAPQIAKLAFLFLSVVGGIHVYYQHFFYKDSEDPFSPEFWVPWSTVVMFGRVQ